MNFFFWKKKSFKYTDYCMIPKTYKKEFNFRTTFLKKNKNLQEIKFFWNIKKKIKKKFNKIKILMLKKLRRLICLKNNKIKNLKFKVKKKLNKFNLKKKLKKKSTYKNFLLSK